jgi:hypothetical protein
MSDGPINSMETVESDERSDEQGRNAVISRSLVS